MRAAAFLAVTMAACAGFPAGGARPYGAPAPRRTGPAPPVETGWAADVAIPAHRERPDPATEAIITEAVGSLGSDDFETYSASARRLVALGVPAIPYLGHAPTRPESTTRQLHVLPVVLGTILEQADPDEVGHCLRSPYRPVRIAGARAAGARGLEQHAPRLVDLLVDDDIGVRRAAVTALRRISQSFHGYRADSSSAARARAAAKWRAHVGA